MRSGHGVEIVEQSGDAFQVRVIHDRPGPAPRCHQIKARQALLDAREIARSHRARPRAKSAAKRGSLTISPHMLVGTPRRSAPVESADRHRQAADAAYERRKGLVLLVLVYYSRTIVSSGTPE
jgi:hypothetical protein